MIRIVSCSKPFSGSTADLQERAIRSWKRITDDIVLVGSSDELETVPASLDVECKVVPARKEISNLPLLGDIFDASVGDRSGTGGEESASVIAYVNADIILPSGFGRIERGKLRLGDKEIDLPEKFLIVGTRWDLDEGVFPSEATDQDSLTAFLKSAHADDDVILHDEHAVDYFVFPRSLFADLKPLIVGRGGYDNALIAYCLRKRIPVIDASREWPVLHQFHGYAHKAGGMKEVYLGDEAMFNRRTHDIVHSPPNSLDAGYVLENGELSAVPWRCGVLRRCESTLRYRWGLTRLSYLFRGAQRFFRTDQRVSKRETARTMKSIFEPAKR